MLKEIDDDFDCFETNDFDSFETNDFDDFRTSHYKSHKNNENSNFKNNKLKHFEEALKDLDDDLKNIVKYDEETSTLSINKLEWSSSYKKISIQYSDVFNKFIIQTENGFYMLNRFNYEVEYNHRDYNNTSNGYLINIKFNIKDTDNNIVFQWIDKKLYEFNFEDFDRCSSLVELDYSKLNFEDTWSFKTDFNIFHDKKIRQVKNVIDEYIKSRIPNLNYKDIHFKKKKCVVKKL